MPVDRLLPEFLQREPESDTDDAVLHECRHCGSKFEEPVSQCPVCDATEIATYEFPAADDSETDDDTESATEVDADTDTDTDTNANSDADDDTDNSTDDGPNPDDADTDTD